MNTSKSSQKKAEIQVTVHLYKNEAKNAPNTVESVHTAGMLRTNRLINWVEFRRITKYIGKQNFGRMSPPRTVGSHNRAGKDIQEKYLDWVNRITTWRTDFIVNDILNENSFLICENTILFELHFITSNDIMIENRNPLVKKDIYVKDIIIDD